MVAESSHSHLCAALDRLHACHTWHATCDAVLDAVSRLTGSPIWIEPADRLHAQGTRRWPAATESDRGATPVGGVARFELRAWGVLLATLHVAAAPVESLPDDIHVLVSAAGNTLGRTMLAETIARLTAAAATASEGDMLVTLTRGAFELTGCRAAAFIPSRAQDRGPWRLVAHVGPWDAASASSGGAEGAPDGVLDARELSALDDWIDGQTSRPRHPWQSFELQARNGQFMALLVLEGSPDAPPAYLPAIESLVQQASIALEHQVHAHALRSLGHLSGRSQDDIGLTRIRTVAERVRERMQADIVVVYPYDAARAVFFDERNIAMVGELRAKDWAPSGRPRPHGLTERIRRNGWLAVHDVEAGDVETCDWSDDHEGLRARIRTAAFVEREGIRSFFGFPLRVGGAVGDAQVDVGVLYVDYRVPRHLSGDERRDLQGELAQMATLVHEALPPLDHVPRHARHFDRFHRSALKLVAQPNVVQALRLVLGEATELLGAKGGKVYLRVPGEEKYQLIEAMGVSPDLLRPGETFSFGDGMAGRVIESRHWMIVGDYREFPGRIPRLADSFGAVMEVPLLVAGEAVGVLCVFDHAGPRRFSEEYDLPIMQMLAQRASLIIRDANLVERVERESRRVRIVNKVAMVLQHELDQEHVLKTLVTEVVKGLACNHCTLFMPPEDAGSEWELVAKESYSNDPTTRAALMQRRFRRGQGLATLVYETGRSERLDDATSHPRFEIGAQPVQGPRSLLLMPIKLGNSVIGVISADHDFEGWFDDNDRLLLEALALHAGVAIARARSLKLMLDVSDQIIAGSEPEQVILERILKGAMELTRTARGVIFLFDEGDHSLEPVITIPAHAEFPPPRVDGLCWEIRKTGRPVYIPDTHADPRVNPLLEAQNIRSLIGIPLSLSGQVIGVLFLHGTSPRTFSEIEQSCLRTLGSQAAVAIQNRRLTRRTQDERRQQLEQIREITGTIAKLLKHRRSTDEDGPVLTGVTPHG